MHPEPGKNTGISTLTTSTSSSPDINKKNMLSNDIMNRGLIKNITNSTSTSESSEGWKYYIYYGFS